MKRTLTEEEIARLHETLFGRRGAEEVQVSKTALLMVDLQNMFCDPTCGHLRVGIDHGVKCLLESYIARLDSTVIPNARILIGVARKVGIAVVHVRIAGTRDDGRDMSQRYKDLGVTIGPDSKEAQLIEGLKPLPNESVVSKTTSSAFNSSGIDLLLRSMGIRTLIVCGVTTNGCVEATVRSAADLGYRVLVVEDACAAYAAQLHEASIRNMGLIHANIRTTDALVAEITRLSEQRHTRISPLS